MSLLQTQTIACPARGTRREADVFYSINADRRPDLRAGAIDGSCQRPVCECCLAAFRVDPDFNYLDMRSVTFGWPAFREKLVAADSALDDLELELLKMAIPRMMDHAPLSDEVELRFMERTETSLILSWIGALPGLRVS
jgi:hypothetical protein